MPQSVLFSSIVTVKVAPTTALGLLFSLKAGSR